VRRKLLRRWLSSLVQEIICVSHHIAHWLKHDIKVRAPVEIIYNGVNTDHFNPRGEKVDRNILGIPKDAFVVGNVGRLDPIKEHRTLLRAFQKFLRTHYNSHLLIIGDGPERKNLEIIAGKNVHFLGNRTDIPELLRTLDVLVLCSRNEGLSNTIMEGMASGLPVIATCVGGNTELVDDGQTGILINPIDTESLGNALKYYATNPEMAIQHGRKGRSKMVRHFSIEEMVKNYEMIYRKIFSQ